MSLMGNPKFAIIIIIIIAIVQAINDQEEKIFISNIFTIEMFSNTIENLKKYTSNAVIFKKNVILEDMSNLICNLYRFFLPIKTLS